MSSPRVSSPRLLDLERVLARDRNTHTANSTPVDRVAQHLRTVPAERIRHLTQALQTERTAAVDNDDIDFLTMRLLLNDFITAVEHLRAVTDIAAGIVDEAAKPVRESQRFMGQQDRREEKKLVASEPARNPPAAPQRPT